MGERSVSAISSKKSKKAEPARAVKLLRACLRIRELNVLSVLLLVGLIISLFSPYFLTTNNLMSCGTHVSAVMCMRPAAMKWWRVCRACARRA